MFESAAYPGLWDESHRPDGAVPFLHILSFLSCLASSRWPLIQSQAMKYKGTSAGRKLGRHLGQLLLLHKRDRYAGRVLSGYRSSFFMLECRRDVQGCSSHPASMWHQANTEDGAQRYGKNLGS